MHRNMVQPFSVRHAEKTLPCSFSRCQGASTSVLSTEQKLDWSYLTDLRHTCRQSNIKVGNEAFLLQDFALHGRYGAVSKCAETPGSICGHHAHCS